MPGVLREQIKKINPWLALDQVEEVTRQLTAGFPGTGLIENNQYVLHLLLENTSVSENRETGEHYLTHVFPNGYKAQVVASSREAAVRYKKYIDAALTAGVRRQRGRRYRRHGHPHRQQHAYYRV
jgi:hypothetical protein